MFLHVVNILTFFFLSKNDCSQKLNTEYPHTVTKATADTRASLPHKLTFNYSSDGLVRVLVLSGYWICNLKPRSK